MNKKIFLSLLLVLLVALSVSAVSAEATDDVVVDDAGVDAVLAADEPAEEPVEGTLPDAVEIQQKIDDAKDGDDITLDENRVYEVAGVNFNVEKTLHFKGNNVTINVNGAAQGGSGATFVVTANDTSFEGIKFNNINGHKNYGEEVSGYGISLQGVSAAIITGCEFIDFNSGVYGSGSTLCTISECYFTGSAEKVTGGGKGEKGTKAINLMGCTNMIIFKNMFDGQVLDAISSASNSANLQVTENYFYNNVYAIFFGGASTQGAIITNNVFEKCGHCLDGDVDIFTGLPTISTQKAANGYTIADNTFVAGEDAILIAAESGNTAHGYPSKIGDINITGNTVNCGEDVDPNSVTFVHILSNSGPLNPYAPIAVTGNTLDAGITPVKVWYADWGKETGDVTIPATPKAATFISVEKVATADNQIVVKLEDTNGAALADKTIAYTVAGGEEQTVTTDADGIATIGDLTDGEIAMSYAGDAQTEASTATVTFTSTASPKLASEIAYEDMVTTAVDEKTDGRNGKWFEVTLKDGEGVILADKAIQIGFNGKIYNRTTDENGQAKLQINLPKAGTYTFAVCFLGDEQYNSSFVVAKITVNKQKPTLTVPNKSYAASAKTKSVTVTMKAESKKVVANKKITVTVNGKSYSATTNTKGVATINVSLNKKGTYTMTAKYAGDNTYAAVTKTAKLTIK